MQYKKINKEGYTLHLIDTDRFKTINLVIFLSKKYNKKEIPCSIMLTQNMVYTSKKYNTKSKMAIIGEDLYGARVSSSYGVTGNICNFTFSLDFLNPKYTEEKYIDLTLDFLCEILFNPNVDENGFKEEYFNIIKSDTITRIKSIKDNPGLYASKEYAKIMYKGSPAEHGSNTTVEEVEKVTREEMYDFYKKLFTEEYKIDICVMGQLNDNLVNKIISRFNHIHGNNESYDLTVDIKYNNEIKEKIDSLPYNQSKLYMGYRLNDLTSHEMNHVLKVYNTILGTMNDSILFNIVREANSLCYSIGSYTSRYNPSLTIYAGINKTNYEKTVNLVKECVSMMSDKKTLERLFDSAKKTINTYLNNYYDDVTSQINHYWLSEFESIEDIELQREEINKVTIDEVIELNNKISLSTIYLLKGEND